MQDKTNENVFVPSPSSCQGRADQGRGVAERRPGRLNVYRGRFTRMDIIVKVFRKMFWFREDNVFQTACSRNHPDLPTRIGTLRGELTLRRLNVRVRRTF